MNKSCDNCKKNDINLLRKYKEDYYNHGIMCSPFLLGQKACNEWKLDITVKRCYE